MYSDKGRELSSEVDKMVEHFVASYPECSLLDIQHVVISAVLGKFAELRLTFARKLDKQESKSQER